jgi:hypothetical protein
MSINIDHKGCNFYDEHLQGITEQFIEVINSHLSLNPDNVSVLPNLTYFTVLIGESEYMDDIMGDIVKGLIIDGICLHVGKNSVKGGYWVHITYEHLKMMLKHYVGV